MKKYGSEFISISGILIMAWLFAALIAPSRPAAARELIQAGGSPGRTRLVFNLETLVFPRLTQEDRTLIVKFPDTIGKPVSLSDIFIIKNLAFDGKTAVISVHNAFTYTSTTSEKPPQFIIDLAVKKDAQASCPVVGVRTSARSEEGGISADILVRSGMWPQIRYARNRRLYLIFKGSVDCSDMGMRLSRIPCLEYTGAIRLQGGTAIGLRLTDAKADMEVAPQESRNKITLRINTSGRLMRSGIYDLAKSSFEQGDIASAIHVLNRHKDSLDSKERILLGRAYWKIAYPYYMDAYSADALKYMGEGVRTFPPGPAREALMLEHARMLMHARMYSGAMTNVRFLKESISSETSIEAYLLEIDIMNRKKQFQDAFVQNRRMLSEIDESGVPERLTPYYHSILADTYLGLSAYAKALKLYKDSLSKNPGMFRADPGLYAKMAEAAFNTNDFAAAGKFFLSAINMSRRDEKSEHLISLGDCLYRMGLKEKAMGVFSEVESIAQGSESEVIAKLKTARIIQENDLGRDDGKLSDNAFREIIEIYDELKSTREYREGALGSIIKIRIAQVYALHRDWDESLEAYLTAWIETKKDDPIRHYAQQEAEKAITARCADFIASEKYDRVFDLYTRYHDTFVKNLKSPEALSLLGKALMELGHLDQARPMLVSAVRNDSPETSEALSALFSIDCRKGNYRAALEWNTRYLREHPQGKDASMMEALKGEILFRAGRFTEAVPLLREAGSRGGRRSLVDLSLLAEAYHKTGNPSLEIETLERIISHAGSMRSPAIEKALYTRANQLKETSNLARAKSLYRKILLDYPQSSYRDWIWYHTAEVLHREGNDREAARFINAVIRESTDKTLRSLATNFLGEMGMNNELGHYTSFMTRFGGQ